MLSGALNHSRFLGALFSAVVVIALLAACAGGGQPSTSKPESSKEPLKIGTVQTLTGPLGSLGENNLVGLEMAFEEINAAGGIMGRKVELIVRDDAGDPTKALQATQELVEKHGVTILAGPILGATAAGTLQYITEQKVAQIGVGASIPHDPQKFPYTFIGAPRPSQMAEPLMQYALDVMKSQKIGILAETAAFGNLFTADVTKMLESKGMRSVATERYTQGTSDMTAQMTNLRKAGAEVIMAGSMGTDIVRGLKTIQGMGWNVTYLCNESVAASVVLKGVDADGLKQAYGYQYARLTFSDKAPLPPKAKEFATRLAKRLNQTSLTEPVQYPPRFYDMGYMLKEAIEKAQSTEGAKVAAALEGLTNFDGVTARFTFTKQDHGGMSTDNLTMIKLTVLKDGYFERAPGY